MQILKPFLIVALIVGAAFALVYLGIWGMAYDAGPEIAPGQVWQDEEPSPFEPEEELVTVIDTACGWVEYTYQNIPGSRTSVSYFTFHTWYDHYEDPCAICAACTPNVVVHKCDRIHADDPQVKLINELTYQSALSQGSLYGIRCCMYGDGTCIEDSLSFAMNHYRTLHP